MIAQTKTSDALLFKILCIKKPQNSIESFTYLLNGKTSMNVNHE